MIPKKIHYCWFGGSPLPELALKCIKSWRKFCPDYDIIEWNESNFDTSCCAYVREAYQAGKWAFVADYARLKVVVEYGGIYMDTDMEVLKNLDHFLNEKAFFGFENETDVAVGIMGCEKGFPLFVELLLLYNQRHFIMPDESFDLTTIVAYITDFCRKKGAMLNNTYQTVEGVALYPKDYFYPMSFLGEVTYTENTHTIHHYSASWHTDRQKQWSKWERRITKKIGERNALKIFHLKCWNLVRWLYSFGIGETIKRIKKL